jgi:hypothetical protein
VQTGTHHKGDKVDAGEIGRHLLELHLRLDNAARGLLGIRVSLLVYVLNTTTVAQPAPDG